MKFSKAQIFSRVHKMPELRFEDQRLTSFAGLLIIQELFWRLDIKTRLRGCFNHLPASPIFGHHIIVLTLIVHLNAGLPAASRHGLLSGRPYGALSFGAEEAA